MAKCETCTHWVGGGYTKECTNPQSPYYRTGRQYNDSCTSHSDNDVPFSVESAPKVNPNILIPLIDAANARQRGKK